MRRFFGALLFAAAALAVSSCGDPAPSTPTSIPDPVLTTEKLEGSFTAGSMQYHLLASRAGQVTLTLKGVGPDASLPIGMEIGVYSTLSCTAVMTNAAATIGNSLVGLSTSSTQLCIRMFDPGTGTIPADSTVTYEIWVDHY
jgi:hypothetical protein